MKKVLFALMVVALCLTAVTARAEMKSKYNVDFYGYVKLDAFYEDGYGIMGNYLVYAPPRNLCGSAACATDEIKNKDATSFGMTARQTRFGFVVTGPENANGLITRARIEGDFYGTGVARSGAANQDVEENKGLFMLRRATVELVGKNWEVLAGNEWMIVSPIFPMTNNYTYGAEVGNAGYRTPQIRFTGYALDKKLIFQVAATNKMGDVDTLDLDTGRMSAVPTWEGGITFKDPKLTLGLTGHYGMEEIQSWRYDENPAVLAQDFGYYGEQVESWSGNVHAIIPMGEMASLSGEFYYGANLDGWYTAGQGNGWIVNNRLNHREALRSMGGWVQLMVAPAKPVKLYVSYSIDDVDDEQLKNAIVEPGYVDGNATTAGWQPKSGNVCITKNQAIAGMVDYSISPSTKISLEYMKLTTDYSLADNGATNLDFNPGKVDRWTLSFWYMF